MKKLLNPDGGKSPGAAPNGTASYGLLLVLMGSLLLNVYQLSEQNQQTAKAQLQEASFSDQTFQLEQNLSACQQEMHQKDSALYALQSVRSPLNPQDNHGIHQNSAYRRQ